MSRVLRVPPRVVSTGVLLTWATACASFGLAAALLVAVAAVLLVRP